MTAVFGGSVATLPWCHHRRLLRLLDENVLKRRHRLQTRPRCVDGARTMGAREAAALIDVHEHHSALLHALRRSVRRGVGVVPVCQVANEQLCSVAGQLGVEGCAGFRSKRAQLKHRQLHHEAACVLLCLVQGDTAAAESRLEHRFLRISDDLHFELLGARLEGRGRSSPAVPDDAGSGRRAPRAVD